MAEVFRVGNGEGRDVQYDYSEAERLWNDSEPTAPGPAGVLSRAAFLSSLDEPQAMQMVEAEARRRRWIRASSLLALGVGAMAALLLVPRAADPNPSSTVAVAATGAAASRLPRAPALGGCTAAAAHVPVAALAPVVEPLPAEPLPAPPVPPAASADRAGASRSRRHGGERRHVRRADAGAPVRAGDWSELESSSPAPPPPPGTRRGHLRPIDVSDPFAP